MLAYAEAEAENLIRGSLYVVVALVDALVEAGKLTGDQVDAVIIASTVAARAAEAERVRRTDRRTIGQNAADFAAGLES